MEILNTASAGTVDKCDCLVTVSKGEGGLSLHLESKVFYEYGEHIHSLLTDCLRKTDVQNARIEVQDMGAFDHILLARLQAALYRSLGQTEAIPWGTLYYE